MIDKKIFYCWFGKGEKSDLNKMCIDSWKKFCPKYEIIEINEDNFDFTISDYAIEGYEKGNWSAVSNTARLETLHNESGFYLDTDVQLLKPLDELREYEGGFITEYDSGQPDSAILGRGSINPSVFELARENLVQGSVLHKIFIRNLYSIYDIHGEDIHTYDDHFTILGEQYFPSIRTKFSTKNTIGIHHFENSWIKHPIKITDLSYPFQKVVVYVNGRKIYEDLDATVKLTILSPTVRWSDANVLGRINYFFNPKVVMIDTELFSAERLDWDKEKNTSSTTTASGMVVTFTTD